MSDCDEKHQICSLCEERRRSSSVRVFQYNLGLRRGARRSVGWLLCSCIWSSWGLLSGSHRSLSTSTVSTSWFPRQLPTLLRNSNWYQLWNRCAPWHSPLYSQFCSSPPVLCQQDQLCNLQGPGKTKSQIQNRDSRSTKPRSSRWVPV